MLDVVIVGGGAAGLTCARRCKALKLSFTVLEAQNRVGGRIHSHAVSTVPGRSTEAEHHNEPDTYSPTQDQDYIELGAQWLAGKSQHRFRRLIEQSGYRKLQNGSDGKQIYISVHGHRTLMKSGAIPLVWYKQLDALQAMIRFDRVGKKLKVLRSGLVAGEFARQMDRISVTKYLRKLCFSTDAFELLRGMVEENTGMSADVISVYELADVIAGMGYSGNLETADEFFFRQGLQNIFSQMASQVSQGDGCGQVRLGCRVSKIKVDSNAGKSVTVCMQDGSVLEARYAIVCVPPHVMADHIEFSPALEEPRQKAIQGHMGGQILKVIAVFEQRFWNELDPKLCGSILSSQQEFNTIFDVSYGQYGILAGFVGHQHAESMRQLGKEATQRKFIDYLQKAYACNAPPIKSFHMYDWIGDQLAGGAFTARRKLGVWADTNFFDMTKPFCDRVMFAGTETAREWRGYIEGALESAERAIRQVELHLQTCATKQ